MPTQQALQNMTQAQRERRQWERAKRERERGSGVVFAWTEVVNRRRRKRGRARFRVVTESWYGEKEFPPADRIMELRPGDSIRIHFKSKIGALVWDRMEVTMTLLPPEEG